MKRFWRVREGLETFVFELDPWGERPGELERQRASWAMSGVLRHAAQASGGTSERVLLKIHSTLVGAAAPLQPSSGAIERRLRGAIADGTLRVTVVRPRSLAVVVEDDHEEVVGWEQEATADGHLWVLSVKLKTPGGEPLAFEKLEVFRHDTGDPVGIILETDKEGSAATIVPSDGTYDLLLLSDDEEEPDEPIDDRDVATHLHCQFFTEDDEVLAGETVQIGGPHGSFDVTTGAEGEIDVPLEPGDYELTIWDQSFKAHTLYAGEHDDAGLHYQFVVQSDYDWEEEHQPGRRHRYHEEDEDNDDGDGEEDV
jgi:hypothetical protein